MARLKAHELIPITASSLVFSKKMRRRTFNGFLLPAILFVALAILVAVEFPVLFPQPYSSTRSGTAFTVPIGSIFGNALALILAGPGTILTGTILARKTRLLADRKATDLVGIAVFVQTLNKIAELRTPRQFTRGGVSKPFPLLPSINSRI